jgi:hypothetical protein
MVEVSRVYSGVWWLSGGVVMLICSVAAAGTLWRWMSSHAIWR